MTRTLALIASAALCMLAMSAPLTARAYAGQDVGPHGQARLFQGRVIAPKAAPGAITEQELECESGGSGLRCSFAVKRGATIREVGADAAAGAVVENRPEGPKSA